MRDDEVDDPRSLRGPWAHLVGEDAKVLTREKEAIKDASKVRAWYQTWRKSWMAAKDQCLVYVEFSDCWKSITGLARACGIPDDCNAMLDFIRTYTSADTANELEF